MLPANTSATALTLTTTLSTKGQVVIPKTVRDALAWPDGMTLAIQSHPQGILLAAAKQYFALTYTLDKKFAKLATPQRAVLASRKTVSF